MIRFVIPGEPQGKGPAKIQPAGKLCENLHACEDGKL